MPITVTHLLVATTPDDPAYEIRPSHWNEAHSVTGAATVAATGAFADLLSKPTTLAGYGITDGATDAELTAAIAAHEGAADPHPQYLTAAEADALFLTPAEGDAAYAALVHATRHQVGGADAIKLDDLAAPDDNTDLNASAAAHGLMQKYPGGTTNFLRADGTFATPSGAVAISTAPIAFTDGDTLRRVTISDAAMTATSKVLGSIIRPDTADDSVDAGYIYSWNVVRRAAGAFDLLIACLGWGFDDPTEKPPNETITFAYTLG